MCKIQLRGKRRKEGEEKEVFRFSVWGCWEGFSICCQRSEWQLFRSSGKHDVLSGIMLKSEFSLKREQIIICITI